MAEWVVKSYVGNWDQRKEAGNDENSDGVCEECRDADGGISQRSSS